MNYIAVIIGTLILISCGIISLIYWYKKIDSETALAYGIYIIIQLILWISVLIVLAQYWSSQP